jgi:hypothetical protein
VCSVTGGDCAVVSGNGSVGTPYTVDIVVDPSSVNMLECGETGLLVELQTADTTCIDLSGAGVVGFPLFATPIIDPAADNILECGIAGLLANISVGETNCIELSGTGTVGNPLLATPVIAAVAGNILECGASGLVAGGADFKTWVTGISTAPSLADLKAHTVTYLATLP